MARLISAAAAALLLAGLATPGLADDLVESWSVAGWEGGAYQNADTGEIYCALGDDYGGGAFIWFGSDSQGIYTNITDPEAFNLETDSTFLTKVRIDKIYAADLEVYVIDPTTININFGGENAVIDALADGEKLYLDDWDIWYTLNGTQSAIPALEACYWTFN